MSSLIFAFACAILGILSVLDGGDDAALWFMGSAIWFHLAGIKANER